MSLQKGLVGHWTMDDRDTSGGTLYDKSAYDNNGNLVNGVLSGSSSIIGESYNFDGNSGTHVDLGVVGDEFAVGRGDFTFSVWANFDDVTDTSTIFELSRYTDAILVRPENDNGGQLKIYMRNDYNDDGDFFPSLDTTTNVWTHLLIRRKNGTVDVFQDTSNIGSNDMDGVFKINQESYIGESVHSSGQSHDGRLSDMRFYNRALSEKEINQLYQMRSQPATTSSPIAEYYDTQSWYDSNGHANNKSELDEFFDDTNSAVNMLTATTHNRDSIYHGLEGQNSTFGQVNSEPSYFTQNDGYSWKISGTFTVDESGTYTFGIDGDDAMDVLIDGAQVTGWYGGHGFNGDVANHSGTIDLISGRAYDFVYRYEEGGGGSGGAIGWKKPSDSSYSLFPANSLTQ